MERINQKGSHEPKFITDGNDTHCLLDEFARLK